MGFSRTAWRLLFCSGHLALGNPIFGSPRTIDGSSCDLCQREYFSGPPVLVRARSGARGEHWGALSPWLLGLTRVPLAFPEPVSTGFWWHNALRHPQTVPSTFDPRASDGRSTRSFPSDTVFPMEILLTPKATNAIHWIYVVMASYFWKNLRND